MQSTLLAGPAYEDCVTLKKCFVAKNSFSFADFENCWRELSFGAWHEYVAKMDNTLISEKNARNVTILVDSLFLISMKWITAAPTSQLPLLLMDGLVARAMRSLDAVATPTSRQATPISSRDIPTSDQPSPSRNEAPPTSTQAPPTSNQGTPTSSCGSEPNLIAPSLTSTTSTSTSATPIPVELREKLCGVYLLWSIFYTLTIKPHVLIRTTPDCWEEICSFHNYLTINKFEEADFMLCQLKADSAFLICHSEVPNCVPNSVVLTRVPKKELLSNCLPSSLPSCPSLATSHLATPLSTHLQAKELAYTQTKEKLADVLPPHLLHNSTLTADLQRILYSS